MNIEDIILGLLDGASTFNYNALIKAIGISLLVIWFFVVVWVWLDSGDRSKSIFFRILSVIGVAIFNVLGLIIYLLIRPKTFVDDEYWSELERRYLLYETAELHDCDACGFQLQPGFNVCPNCSNPVRLECENCEMMINREWAFCPYCSFEQKPVTQDRLDMKTASLVTGMAVSAKDKKKSITETKTVERSEDSERPVDKNKEEVGSVEPESGSAMDLPEQEDQQVPQDATEGVSEEIESVNEQRPSSAKKPDPASRLGGAVLAGLYNIGEKIHMTALKISGPLNSDPVGNNGNSAAENDNNIEDRRDEDGEKDDDKNVNSEEQIEKSKVNSNNKKTSSSKKNKKKSKKNKK